MTPTDKLLGFDRRIQNEMGRLQVLISSELYDASGKHTIGELTKMLRIPKVRLLRLLEGDEEWTWKDFATIAIAFETHWDFRLMGSKIRSLNE